MKPFSIKKLNISGQSLMNYRGSLKKHVRK